MLRRLTTALAVLAAVAGCDATTLGRSVGPGLGAEQRIATFRAALARDPNDAAALRGIGDEHFARADWSLAAGAYREALIVAPRDRATGIRYSVTLAAQRDYATALAQAQRALAGGSDVGALMATAIALNGTRRHGEARALLDRAVAAAPRDLDVRNNLALTMALMGDTTGYAVQRAVAFAPDADVRHRRNLFLVGSILGLEERTRPDGAALGVDDATIGAIYEIGRRARGQGVDAFGIALAARR